ncbi:hypothetical protein VOLCADRAFT_90829 [Volvox carteri f. nagariensis]|uniref:Serine aminopeptidase S33 domain-containing protein n=1 Tax=Volvox carteri f. nagariensis TaxID=3068 RepID=D8TV60_VOLCA|nr:uncharacterized protein VOLCADRAFT_90829 [Volvox carteri f. nagariensis]EFJ48521.1 hypothetical protein VOLCADRAFT_90829 [Volvox carteri f. nagariensis]|eukprot:XP_002950320.1 hypothetical protein VOLCADRAFT_90829 [Volvox carteri f. nagariensis]
MNVFSELRRASTARTRALGGLVNAKSTIAPGKRLATCKLARPKTKCSRQNVFQVLVDGSSATIPVPGARRRQRNARHGARLMPRPGVPFPATSVGSTSPATSVSGSEQDLTVDLDYAPSLGPLREVLCVLAPVLLVALLYVATGHLHYGLWPANLASIVLAAALASLARSVWLEKAYKARERAFAALGDPDSRFRPFTSAAAGGARGGVQQLVVHVKVKVGDLNSPTIGNDGAESDGAPADDGSMGDDAHGGGTRAGGAGAPEDSLDAPASQGGNAVTAVHCYHGFGANLGSYKRVQEEMAAALRGVVTAHDMPGFGLTQRPSDISSYFLTFNGRLGRFVMDYELQQLGLIPPGEAVQGQRQFNSTAAYGDICRRTGGPVAAFARRDPKHQLQLEKAPGETSASPKLPRFGTGTSVPSASVAAPGAVGPDGDPLTGEVLMKVASAEAASPDSSGERVVAQQHRCEDRGEGQTKQAARVAQTRAIKRILIGHSLGGACASLEAVANPDDLAGLVLVAPAVIALPGPEYQAVTLSPDRPSGESLGTAEAAAAEQLRTAHARAAAHLGSEPIGTHVTDPPEVRRLYPVGPMPGGPGSGFVTSGNSAGAGDCKTSRGERGGVRAGTLLRAARMLLVALASLALMTVLRLLAPVITLLLRSLVRRRTFWVKGLQQAYYNPGAVTQDIVDSYRLPQLVSGWESGMVNFLLARLTRPNGSLQTLLRQASKILEPASTSAALAATAAAASALAKRSAATARELSRSSSSASAAASASTFSSSSAASSFSTSPRDDDGSTVVGNDKVDEVEGDGDLATRLAALVASRGLPVLIIHGLYDRLVPASNSQRLARMLPGCELVLLDRCGHMPQEELPQLFVNLVAEFAARLP